MSELRGAVMKCVNAYVGGLEAALGCVLAAALVVGLYDLGHTGDGLAPAPALLGLWCVVALPMALFAGVVLGGGNLAWGDRFVMRTHRRLLDDVALDRSATGVIVVGAFAVLLIGGIVTTMVKPLVLDVQRQGVGAMVLGVVAMALIPIAMLSAIPLYRPARFAGWLIPRFGPFPRVLTLLVLAALLLAAIAWFIIFHRLDSAGLKLGFLFSLVALPVIAVAFAILAYGPLAKLRERIPARRPIVIVATVIAVVLPIVGLGGTPTPEVQTSVIDHSYLGSVMIAQLRNHIDHDGDGFSAFFGGPDCDDDNPNVNPDAIEIPGNGIDDNCIGGDAPLPPPETGSGSAGSGSGVALAAPGPTISGGQNVLIIFIDTLRFDHLGFTGYQRDGASLTPRIDAFAKQAVLFRRAYSQAPNTPRSVPSFLTSRYPSQVHFDVQKKSYATVEDDNDVLFEPLHDAGFKTFGESSHFYFCDAKKRPKDCAYDNPKRANIDQGVDVWDNSDAVDILPSNHDIAGPRIVMKTIAKLDQLASSKDKFALLVHLFDPHGTYMEHPKFKYKTGSLIEKYDYEVAFEDELIGQLLDELDRDGLAANTTVVLMADHGEAFGEHVLYGERDFFHGDSLYNELVHVPLMFRLPGGKAGCTRDDVVQLVDMAPTVVSLFGVAAPRSWVGRSLAPALACDQPSGLAAQPAFAELLPEPMWDHGGKAMVTADGKRHVYYRITDNRWEIYDLETDPLEQKNLADGAEADKLKALLAQWMEGPLEAGKKKR